MPRETGLAETDTGVGLVGRQVACDELSEAEYAAFQGSPPPIVSAASVDAGYDTLYQRDIGRDDGPVIVTGGTWPFYRCRLPLVLGKSARLVTVDQGWLVVDRDSGLLVRLQRQRAQCAIAAAVRSPEFAAREFKVWAVEPVAPSARSADGGDAGQAHAHSKPAELVATNDSEMLFIELETLTISRTIDLRGQRLIGFNLGMELRFSTSKFGYFAQPEGTNRLVYYDLPTNQLVHEDDLGRFKIRGKLVGLAAGERFSICCGGYGGVLLYDEGHGYVFYDNELRRSMRLDPRIVVEDMWWTMHFGLTPRPWVYYVQERGGVKSIQVLDPASDLKPR